MSRRSGDWKIRSGGGGVAISVNDDSFGSHNCSRYKNFIEALNVPDTLWVTGKRLFFLARPATEAEKNFIITADGAESKKPIIYVTKITEEGRPSLNDKQIAVSIINEGERSCTQLLYNSILFPNQPKTSHP